MKNKKTNAVAFRGKTLGMWALVLVLLAGCNNDKTKKADQQSKEEPQVHRVPVPAFNGDSAYAFVKRQVDFGPRVPNTSAHDRCGDYLIYTLKRYGWEVQVQSFEAQAFDGKNLKLRNIIASYNPKADKRILLAAHWDTRPFADQDSVDQGKPIDGANDGGSGVGVLLEIARLLSVSNEKTNAGIDIVLFDGEDYGATEMFEGNHQDTYCLGSQYWAKNRNGYTAYFGILLDMVGARDAKFAKEGISSQFAPSVVNMVWNTARTSGYGNVFIDLNAPPITDDHLYINNLAHIPVVDIIEYDNTQGNGYFGAYWHTHKDNMKVIDKGTLKAVGQVLLEVVYNSYQLL